MVKILGVNGEVVSRSRNLRGLRTFVSKNIVRLVAIDEVGDGEGKLCVMFDKNSCETNFASFEVLKGFVKRWKNVHGAKLLVNTVSSGLVEPQNPLLG